ncbi:hypothetical protein JXO59_15850 [candidate division KSB1 bacterium]|nr:hypothetical protein [candidate division KSB1 bacterium]
MHVLRFDYRDLFRAPRLAFSMQRIWIQFFGMSIGYGVYLVLTYIAFLINGTSITQTWEAFGLAPCLFAAWGSIAWYAWLAFAFAIFALFFVFLITNTAVARVTYMVSKGNHFYSSREALSFSLRKMAAVLSTPSSLLLLLVCMVVGSMILGLIGRIAYFGELVVGIFSILWFLSALLFIYIFLVFLASFLLTPSIIACTDEDAFEAVFQTFSITWGQPWRLILYEIITIILALFSMGVLAFLGKRAIMLTNVLLCRFMGMDYIILSNNGQALVQNWIIAIEAPLRAIYHNFTGQIFFTNEFIYTPTNNVALTIASFLFALSLLCFGAWILAYGLSTFTVGNTLTYLILRHKKDGENLLERKDKEEESEESETNEVSSEQAPG